MNHETLLNTLVQIGFPLQVVGVIRSYLQGREQSVLVKGEPSPFLPVRSGLPQGSLLGPLMFICPLNNLPDLSLHGNQMVVYADDVLSFRVVESDMNRAKLQQDLNALSVWAAKNQLTLNSKE